MTTLLRKRVAIRFGDFEADLGCRELRKQGQSVKIQEKPFEVLTLLLERAGELVGREELRNRLWPEANHGDLDHNLNVCVAKLRHILSESEESPRYIQTVAARGYCFTAPVDVEADRNRVRIAVISFDSWNTRPQQQFCRGLTAEISIRLTQLYSEQVAVIAESSMAKYRNSSKTSGQIGRELKIDYMLEVGVRGAVKHLHITTELIRVKDETYSWAESHDFTGGDNLTLQNQIADTVARSVGIKLLPASAPRT